jgi:WD40 repeat protein
VAREATWCRCSWKGSQIISQRKNLFFIVVFKVYHSLVGHTGPVYGVSFSPCGRYLLSASEDSTVRLWGLETSTKVRMKKKKKKTKQKKNNFSCFLATGCSCCVSWSQLSSVGCCFFSSWILFCYCFTRSHRSYFRNRSCVSFAHLGGTFGRCGLFGMASQLQLRCNGIGRQHRAIVGSEHGRVRANIYWTSRSSL